jgi:hypothetical protein
LHTDTCDDTTWLGGTPDNKTTIQQGVIIGQPFYASFYAPVWGTSGQLLVSYLDANALIGWSNEFPFSGNNYTGTGTNCPCLCRFLTFRSMHGRPRHREHLR